MKKTFLLLAAILLTAALTSCSSAPKRTMQISTVYKNVTTTLETANSAMINGNYEQAENLLGSAYQSAMSIDNYDLLTTVCLSYVSLYLSFEQPDTAKANLFMEEAKFCAAYANSPVQQESLCTLSQVRLELAQGNTEYTKYISQLDSAQKNLKANAYNDGLFASVKGDVYRAKKDYANAESSYSQAAALFTKNRYLGEIGITWYKLAQIRSLAGNKKSALEAIQNAIKYDRDSENSIALATDYYAMGKILTKGTPSTTELSQANYCYNHSAQIFNSIGMKPQAKRSLEEIRN